MLMNVPSRKPSKSSILPPLPGDFLPKRDLFSRKAAKSAHPDKGGSEDKMAAVNEAYEVLTNPG